MALTVAMVTGLPLPSHSHIGQQTADRPPGLSTYRIRGESLLLSRAGMLATCIFHRYVWATGCASSDCPCGMGSQGPSFILTPRDYSGV